MSDLQLSLIAIGTAAVAAVFAYNKWQEWKHRKLAERVFRSQHADVLLDAGRGQAASGERVEPVIGGGEATRGDEASGSADRGAMAAADRGEAPVAHEPPRELLDPAIACVVRFESAETIAGGYLWQAQNQALGKLGKLCWWVGLNERAGAWEAVTAHGGGDYRRLRAGLQLADRRGPVSDADVTLFFNGVQRLADEFLAVADMPPRGEVLAQAADLDQFCAGVDIQIGINVVSQAGAFAATKLRALAEAAGLALQEDGMFHGADEAGRTLFTLANLEPALFAADELKVLTTHGVTFTLDVPRVADGAAAFDRMVALARQFAATLGGMMVDDNRVPLADSALAVIHDKILEIGHRMVSHGIQAGGPQALRLFA